MLGSVHNRDLSIQESQMVIDKLIDNPEIKDTLVQNSSTSEFVAHSTTTHRFYNTRLYYLLCLPQYYFANGTMGIIVFLCVLMQAGQCHQGTENLP
jgi:hypothetical protein